MNEALARHPLLLMRLSGSQREMGRQHGILLRAHGGYEEAMGFYPTMASRMLSLSVPHALRRPFERVARAALGLSARVLHRHRARQFPEYVARTQALLEESGTALHLAPSFVVMDVLQNTVALLARAGAIPAHIGRFAAVPACSSLAVWDDASSDGTLRHARNFDFPGAGVWDEAPAVVLCSPDEGLRYGFVTTRGADTPGITCFNEAGLTLTMHTRFHRDVRFDAAPVVDIGHEIIRCARTLDEAVRVARRIGSASTWGVLVSSANEHDAVLIETTGNEVAVTRPTPGASHLGSTNRYVAPTLRDREVTSSRAFISDSASRLARLEQAVAEATNGLSTADLEALLGDYGSPYAHDVGDGVARLSGDCIVSPMTVQSIVAEPEAQRVRVSVGRAPTGFGPYVTVPFRWDGPTSEIIEPDSEAQHASSHKRHALDAEARTTIRLYADTAKRHVAGEAPAAIRASLEALVRRVPNEPGFRTLAGYAAIAAGDLDAARVHLDAALGLEGGAFRRARLLLFQTRVLTVLGDVHGARRARTELLAMTGAETLAERVAVRGEEQKPISRAALSRIVLDIMLVDASLPSAA